MHIQNKMKRLVKSILLFIILFSIVAYSWYLSNITGAESNELSKGVAKVIEELSGKYFPINHSDTFWHTTLNSILRKIAHFMEYMLIGAMACLFFNTLFRKVWHAALSAIVLCPLLAYIDEYKQQFPFGRAHMWADVRLDAYGALLGIFIITLIFFIYRYIQKLQARIYSLENQRNS